MQHDPVRVAEARAWLHKAAGDLRAAAHDGTATPPLLGDALFHCQPAAEKAMKGFLCWHDVAARKTHDLEELGEACLSIDATLRELIDRAVPLSEYAWLFRYPGDPVEPTSEEVAEALETARQTYEAIASRLPPAARP